MNFYQLIEEALKDETGAGFTVRVWIKGANHPIEMSFSDFRFGSHFLTGHRLTDKGYEVGPMTVRVVDISAMEIVW